MIWFTSDTHFGHQNILKYTDRPFSSVEEMDEALIENWNNRVGDDDEIYHLGDVALCSPNKLRKVLARLKGKIYLIRGNHDKSASACSDRFEWIKDYYELEVADKNGYQGKQLIILFHYLFLGFILSRSRILFRISKMSSVLVLYTSPQKFIALIGYSRTKLN